MDELKKYADLMINMSLSFKQGEMDEETYLSNLKAVDRIINYDSEADTLKHIKRVNELLIEASKELLQRAVVHDNSKLSQNEKPFFDRLTPKLKKSTYGSDEYNAFLEELKEALEHHYAWNSHHPEHYPDGLNGMNLFDLMEMFFDWKAAGERHANGNIYKSIEINKKRFGLSDQMEQILINTAKYLKYK